MTGKTPYQVLKDAVEDALNLRDANGETLREYSGPANGPVAGLRNILIRGLEESKGHTEESHV